MTISCKNVAKLLLSEQLQSQKWWKRMEVRLHLSMCDLCSRLVRQIKQLRAGARTMSTQAEPDSELEERLIRKISGQ